MRGPRPTRLRALALGACLAVAGCGSSDSSGEIPPENASAMLDRLGDLQSAAASDSCDGARQAVVRFQEQVGALPDEAIRDDLDQATGQLNDLVDQEVCTQEGGPTDTTTEEAVEPTTTTEEAVEPTTTETTTTEEETTAPPEEEGGGQPAPKPEPQPAPEPPSENAPVGPEGNPSEGNGGVGVGSGEGG